MSVDQQIMKPRKSARQARSEATVEVIVEAAARILETAGLAGYTTNVVAERAGVSVGSLYQYFPNKNAITRALIRRELEALWAAVAAIEMAVDTDPLAGFVAVAVGQQLRRPALAQLLEVEEERLEAADDIDIVRHRVAESLTAILAARGDAPASGVVQDILALTATLVNAAASRGELDAARLVARVTAVIDARLAAD